MKIKTQLLLGFSITIPLILGLGVVSYINMNQVEQHYASLVEQDLQVLQNAQELQKLVVDAETGLRGFVITSDEEFLEPYHWGTAEFHSLIDIEKELVSANPYQVRQLEKIEELFDEWNQNVAIPAIEDVRGTSDGSLAYELISTKAGKTRLDNMRVEFQEFIAITNDMKDQRFMASQQVAANTQSLILIIMAASIISAIVIASKIASHIVKPILSLENSMKHTSQGIPPENISLEGSDETKSLGNSFLSMIKKIEKTNELEKELAISNEKIKNEKFATLGLLSSRLSHDLRNPLTVIKSLTSLQRLKNKDNLTPDDIARYDQIEEAVQNMVHQIEGVLEFVQQKPLNYQKTSVSKLLKNALNYIESSPSVTINLPSDDIEITCDSRKIEVVLYNIMSNAIQAMNSEGTLSISLKQKNDFVTIDIEDSGPGVPEELLNKVFDPLFTTKNLGTGLGLSTCKSIAEQHGGTITVQNKPSIFSLKLPVNLSSELDVLSTSKT